MLPRPTILEMNDGPVIVGATGASRRPTSEVMSGRLGPAAVLGEERLFERWLAADEVEQVVVRGLADDRRDRARDAHLQHVLLGDDVADARQHGERAHRRLAGEPQLDLVMGQVAERFDAIDFHEQPVADDRDAVAGLLDLAEDVAREKDRPALRLRLADELVERLLDERVEPGRRLVEHQQVRPVLEGDDQADLLLVALRVLLELAAGIEVQALDELLLVRRLDAASEVREVLDRLAAGELVVERELAREVAQPAMDLDRVHGRVDAEDRRLARRGADVVEQRPDRRRLAGAVWTQEAERLALGDFEVD